MTTQRPLLFAAFIGLAVTSCAQSGVETSGGDDSTKESYPSSAAPPTGSGSAPTISFGSDTSTTTSAPSTGWGGSTGSIGTATGASIPADPPSATVDPVATSTSTSTTPQPTQQAGQLTAGTWDDNLNFDFYTSYLDKELASHLPGIPVIDRSVRMVLRVADADGSPVAGAAVVVADAAGHVFTSTTGAEGRVLYFPGWNGVAAGSSLTITASLGGDSAEQTALAADGTIGLTLAATVRPVVAALDLAFVIDTTGSMGDELAYVQGELDDIAGGIAGTFPGLAQRYALIVYRDDGDDYVVRSFDFTADLASFRSNLTAQASFGGGDTPEAVDRALTATGELSWRTGIAARVAFWIADAPHHVGRQAAVVAALQTTVSRAVHIYPVAASGIDDLGEFTMRTAAEVTGGRYLFLTDDSGIGNAHAEPHIPCYDVTTLASAIRRMVATEVTGAYVAPEPTEIIRTSGAPVAQQCVLSDGSLVTVW